MVCKWLENWTFHMNYTFKFECVKGGIVGTRMMNLISRSGRNNIYGSYVSCVMSSSCDIDWTFEKYWNFSEYIKIYAIWKTGWIGKVAVHYKLNCWNLQYIARQSFDQAMMWSGNAVIRSWHDQALTWSGHVMIRPWHDQAMLWSSHDMIRHCCDQVLIWSDHVMIRPFLIRQFLIRPWHDQAMLWSNHDIFMPSHDQAVLWSGFGMIRPCYDQTVTWSHAKFRPWSTW